MTVIAALWRWQHSEHQGLQQINLVANGNFHSTPPLLLETFERTPSLVRSTF
jgi:hypothetical protein